MAPDPDVAGQLAVPALLYAEVDQVLSLGELLVHSWGAQCEEGREGLGEKDSCRSGT